MSLADTIAAGLRGNIDLLGRMWSLEARTSADSADVPTYATAVDVAVVASSEFASTEYDDQRHQNIETTRRTLRVSDVITLHVGDRVTSPDTVIYRVTQETGRGEGTRQYECARVDGAVSVDARGGGA